MTIRFFSSKIFPENKIQPNIQYPIYLGAGSGAWTKQFLNKQKIFYKNVMRIAEPLGWLKRES